MMNAAAPGAPQPARAQIDTRMPSAPIASVASPEAQRRTADPGVEADRSAGNKVGEEMKARLVELIQAQVDSGTLSADQAGELQTFFTQPPAGTSKDSLSAPPAPGDGGGPISEAASMKLDAMEAFLGRLRESSAAATGGYGSASARGAVTTGLVLDSFS